MSVDLCTECLLCSRTNRGKDLVGPGGQSFSNRNRCNKSSFIESRTGIPFSFSIPKSWSLLPGSCAPGVAGVCGLIAAFSLLAPPSRKSRSGNLLDQPGADLISYFNIEQHFFTP